MPFRLNLSKGLHNLVSNSPPKTERLLALFLTTVITVLMAVMLLVMNHSLESDLSDHYKDTSRQKSSSAIKQIERYIEVRLIQAEIVSKSPIVTEALLNPSQKNEKLRSFFQKKNMLDEYYPQALFNTVGKLVYFSKRLSKLQKISAIHNAELQLNLKPSLNHIQSKNIQLDQNSQYWIIHNPILNGPEEIGMLLTYLPLSRMNEKLGLLNLKGLRVEALTSNGNSTSWGAKYAKDWTKYDDSGYQIDFSYGVDLSILNESLKSAQIKLMLSSFFIALISIWLSVMIGRWFFVRPLERLQVFAADISKDSDSGLTETKRITVEIQSLSNTISKMAREINKREKDLLSTNIALKENQNILLQSEKMAGLGQVTAGVAHEINTPIGFIISNLRTLKEYHLFLKALIKQLLSLMNSLSENEKASHKIILKDIEKTLRIEDLDYVIEDLDCLTDESLKGTERIKDITFGLKGYSHAGEQKTLLDLNESIESTLSMVWNELKYNCTVQKDLKPLPPVECIGGQINQVLLNLFINASHAMLGKKGELSIQTYSVQDEVFIIISDNGCGIPRDDFKRIFEPFFTTKPLGEGTGLGMSISFDIIKQHGGNIQVESEVGFGTSFMITLPAAKTLENSLDK